MGLDQAPRRTSGSCSGIAHEALGEAHPKAHLKLRLKQPLLTLYDETRFGQTENLV
jgi:hypothetical protein